MTPSQRQDALLAWYATEARELPWRGETDPYRVLVSEFMLQQTQVGRVIEAYEPFLDAFPTVDALARASVAEVVKQWSGLGFNRRALRLHQAATLISSEGWPVDVAGLRALPGVGAYTAAAVGSFAFGWDLAAVDTNHRRVLSRWHGSPLTGRELADVAGSELPSGHSATWNQALMDLAAAICRPNPRCAQCPVASYCTDPSIYEPPRSQGVWEGSSRQTRGLIVKTLVEHGRMTIDELSAEAGAHRDRIVDASRSLLADGLVAETDGVLTLAK